MMRTLTLMLLLVMNSAICQAQLGTTSIHLHSGYLGYQMNKLKDHTNTETIPLGLSATTGSANFQAGIALRYGLTPPTFVFYDPYTREERFFERFTEQYVGAMLRLNTAADPSYFGATFSLSGGALFGSRVLVNKEKEQLLKEAFKPAFMATASVGLSIPFTGQLNMIVAAEGVHVRQRSLKNESIIAIGNEQHNVWGAGVQVGLLAYFD